MMESVERPTSQSSTFKLLGQVYLQRGVSNGDMTISYTACRNGAMVFLLAVPQCNPLPFGNLGGSYQYLIVLFYPTPGPQDDHRYIHTGENLIYAFPRLDRAPVLASSGWALLRRSAMISAPYSTAFLAHAPGSVVTSPHAEIRWGGQSAGLLSCISIAITGLLGHRAIKV